MNRLAFRRLYRCERSWRRGISAASDILRSVAGVEAARLDPIEALRYE